MLKTRNFSGTKDPSMQPYESMHREVARKAAADSIVMLKNDEGLLPIAVKTSIALYGAGASHTVKGGTGSGDVNERYSVTIEEGLRNAGYIITTDDWINDYNLRFDEARSAWKDKIWEKLDETSDITHSVFDAYSETPFSYPAGDPLIYKTEADIALYVLARRAGEGSDRYEIPGDYYLSDEEAQIVEAICALYPDVVLVINSGGPVDLSFIDKYTNIKAVLQISQLGCEGGNGFADVLSGKVTPSGKLTDSWAFNYKDYPSSPTFSHNDGDTDKELYTEGIYVGYRYFDSFDIPVRYGFGFGLSYTEFKIKITEIRDFTDESGLTKFEIKALVKNAGSTAGGKEVVQVYVSCPRGKLSKEYRRLAGFAKTGNLAPGETQEITVTFSVYDIASYCEQTPGWILESGTYGIFVGNSLERSEFVGSISIPEELILVRTENICPVREDLSKLECPEDSIEMRRKSWLEEKDSFPCITVSKEKTATEVVIYGGESDRILAKVSEFVDTLTLDELINLATGKEKENCLPDEMMAVPGSAGRTSGCARNRGLADLVVSDGPAGLRLGRSYFVKDDRIVPEPSEKSFENGYLLRDYKKPEGDEYFQYCTAFPVGTALAQSWDTSLLFEVGTAIGEEMQFFMITGWLAPGMNIHRNPLCGRNFEYYSEDPLLSGEMAAAVTSGVQSEKGCGTTIKHFACNNQEDNRFFCDSVVSERALREIYLKGFEIAVKKAHPMMLMTSYNLINGIHSANNYDLCTKVLRDEWQFDGLIMTDWGTTSHGDDCTAAGCMRAGNDIVMPGSKADRENIRFELDSGELDIEKVKLCVSHLVNVIWKSNMYE